MKGKDHQRAIVCGFLFCDAFTKLFTACFRFFLWSFLIEIKTKGSAGAALDLFYDSNSAGALHFNPWSFPGIEHFGQTFKANGRVHAEGRLPNYGYFAVGISFSKRFSVHML
jgi:hypothetical protein